MTCARLLILLISSFVIFPFGPESRHCRLIESCQQQPVPIFMPCLMVSHLLLCANFQESQQRYLRSITFDSFAISYLQNCNERKSIQISHKYLQGQKDYYLCLFVCNRDDNQKWLQTSKLGKSPTRAIFVFLHLSSQNVSKKLR